MAYVSSTASAANPAHPEGEDLLERSRDVLARAEAIRERARELTAGAVGRLRVGATSQTFQSVMAGFLAEYRRSRPSIEVTLTEAGGVRLLDLVAHGDLDFAVGGILPGTRFGGRLLFPFVCSRSRPPGGDGSSARRSRS